MKEGHRGKRENRLKGGRCRKTISLNHTDAKKTMRRGWGGTQGNGRRKQITRKGAEPDPLTETDAKPAARSVLPYVKGSKSKGGVSKGSLKTALSNHKDDGRGGAGD